MKKTKKSIKCHNMMFEQELRHMNLTVDEIKSKVENDLKPEKWAMIIHDMDLKDDGKTPADEHIHLFMHFTNSRHLNNVAKILHEPSQYIQKWDNRANNGFAYLVHATIDSRHKHQYSADEVTANFNYFEFIAETMKKVGNISSANKIKSWFDLVATGKMTLKEVKDELTGCEYAKYSQQLQRVHELYLERHAEKLHKEMKKNNEHVEAHWLYGKTETGKTFKAKELAGELGDYYFTTTQKDAFQYYQAQPIIVLDELRPESIPFSELLAMFDPFSHGKITVSSRYFNKALACKTFFITSPYNPVEFYEKCNVGDLDLGNQLYRRLSSVIKFDEDYIYKMKYDEKIRDYIQEDKKDNPYSRKNQPKYTPKNIFDEI